MQKKISVVIPTYNEEENVGPLSKAIMDILEQQLSEYDYEIIFIDNHSKDTTRVKLRKICEEKKESRRYLTPVISVRCARRCTG